MGGPPLACLRSSLMGAELIFHGADVNATDDMLVTPLMRASERGQTDEVWFLLAALAYPMAVDCNGKTAIDWAYELSWNPSEDVAVILLRGGVVPGNREAVLEKARHNGHDRV